MNSRNPDSLDTLKASNLRLRRWNVVLVAVAVFLALIVTAQMFTGAPETSDTAQESDNGAGQGNAGQDNTVGQGAAGAVAEHDFVRRQAEDPFAIGDVDAPVVLTMWTDLRCPFCALFSRDTLPILIEEYVETNKVRIEFYDVALFGEQSEEAAVAALAAARQDKYLEFVTGIYEAAPERGHSDLPRERLITFAEQADVTDLDQFVADLDDPAVQSEAKASSDNARRAGVTAVPFFVAGQLPLSGAQPVDNFRKLLDDALAAAE